MKLLGEKITCKYFVYADVDLNTLMPFYYGSGNIDRILEESRNKEHDVKICYLNKNFIRYIIYQSNNRKECYDIEKIYIALNYDLFKKNKRIITNKIVDSNNHNEINKYKKSPKQNNAQPKLIEKFKGRICKNRKYFLITGINDNKKYLATTINQILNFKNINFLPNEFLTCRFKYENIGKKKIIEQGKNQKYQIEKVKGKYLFLFFNDILKNIDYKSFANYSLSESRIY